MAADLQKKRAALHAVSLVQSGTVLGLGTGTTAGFALAALRARMDKEDFKIVGVCTSSQTERLARDLGIPTKPLSSETKIDLYLDGADEINPSGHIIKGGGGALLREKLVAVHSARRIIMVDDSKLVERLGRHPLPLEIVKFGYTATVEKVSNMFHCGVKMRMQGNELFVTDEGHYIADCTFGPGIDEPRKLNIVLDSITGIVETGLFIDMCDMLVVGSTDGVRVTEFDKARRSSGGAAKL